MDTKQHEMRRYLGLAWMAGALLYTSYAAYTYSGLFEWACEWQDRVFGAHDTTGAFLNVLILCALPAFAFAPELRHLGKQMGPGSVTAVPAWSAAPAPDARLASPDPAQQARILAMVGGGCLLAGLVAGAVSLSRAHGAHETSTIDLLQGQQNRDIGNADRVIVNGILHSDETAVLTKTLNGSPSEELSFTPFTGKDWDERQPIQYVLRAGVGVSERQSAPTVPLDELGEDVNPHAPRKPDRNQPRRVGPVAVLRHELPGEVRSDWQKRGLILSPSLIVLDENLTRGSESPLAACVMGCLLGVLLLGLSVSQSRRSAYAAPRASR